MEYRIKIGRYYAGLFHTCVNNKLKSHVYLTDGPFASPDTFYLNGPKDKVMEAKQQIDDGARRGAYGD